MITKKTILIVDDSEFVRSYHSYILEEADFQVITAVDGSDGLEKLYTNSCDLVWRISIWRTAAPNSSSS